MPAHDLAVREWPELAAFFPGGDVYPEEVQRWPPPWRRKWNKLVGGAVVAGLPPGYAEKRATVLMRRQMADPTTSQRMQDGSRIVKDAVERPRMASRKVTRKDRRLAREEGVGLFDISDATESNKYQPGEI